MKQVKMLGLLAVAATALMAFAGSASATELTTLDGGVHKMVEAGTTINATNVGNVVLDGPPEVTCKKSTISGKTSNTGGSTETVEGPVESLTFTECGSTTISVIKGGILTIHTTETNANSNGTLTSDGAIVTILTHNILGTIHCEYKTDTHLGHLDGSDTTGGTATITIEAQLQVNPTPGFGCGSIAVLTAEYTVNTPGHLDVD